jgi:uncharacterized membrane protein YGL010W
MLGGERFVKEREIPYLVYIQAQLLMRLNFHFINSDLVLLSCRHIFLLLFSLSSFLLPVAFGIYLFCAYMKSSYIGGELCTLVAAIVSINLNLKEAMKLSRRRKK